MVTAGSTRLGNYCLGVVPGLQSLHIVCLAGLLCAGDEAVQAVIDDFQVCVELPLAGHNVARYGDVPVGYIEGGPVLCLLQHPVHSLQNTKASNLWFTFPFGKET